MAGLFFSLLSRLSGYCFASILLLFSSILYAYDYDQDFLDIPPGNYTFIIQSNDPSDFDLCSSVTASHRPSYAESLPEDSGPNAWSDVAYATAGHCVSSNLYKVIFTGNNHFGNPRTWHIRITPSTSGGTFFDPQDYLPEPDFSDYDAQCQAAKPTFLTMPDGLAPVGESFSWDFDGCRFTTSSLWLQNPSGSWSATVLDAEAIATEPSASPPVEIPGGTDSSNYFTLTTDPSNDCPFNHVSYDGSTYCYTDFDAPRGNYYSDGSSRINHWDGSYTVIDSENNSVTYNRDGSPSGTASTAPGAVGPGTDGSGCPPWAPTWLCKESEALAVTVAGGGGGGDFELGSGWGDGDAGFTDPTLPVESFDFSQDAQTWDSGLATTAQCPAPQVVNLSVGSWSSNLEFSYQGFCDFASYIRALVLAAAYMASAFLVFRGLT